MRRSGSSPRWIPCSGSVRGSARVGNDATDIAAGRDAVWIGDRDGSLYRVDASSRDVQEFPVGAEVLAVGVDADTDAVWVYLGRPIRPAN